MLGLSSVSVETGAVVPGPPSGCLARVVVRGRGCSSRRYNLMYGCPNLLVYFLTACVFLFKKVSVIVVSLLHVTMYLLFWPKFVHCFGSPKFIYICYSVFCIFVCVILLLSVCLYCIQYTQIQFVGLYIFTL